MTTLTPKQARSAKRFDHLLDVTAELIAQNGLMGFALSTVGKRAGLSQGSLYQCVSSKDALLRALHDRVPNRALLVALRDRLADRCPLLVALRDRLAGRCPLLVA